MDLNLQPIFINAQGLIFNHWLFLLLLIADAGGTVVLVGQDGVQRPPIHFPRGGHLLAFLSCLENGLLPNGQLDPPLWFRKGKGIQLMNNGFWSLGFFCVWIDCRLELFSVKITWIFS